MQTRWWGILANCRYDMSAIMQFIEATFKPMVLVFVVANMGVLGLQAKIGEVIDTFKNKKA
ncbi:MAG: hypothetical protein ACYSYW_10565, partial [Planctomycetota bacterium]